MQNKRKAGSWKPPNFSRFPAAGNEIGSGEMNGTVQNSGSDLPPGFLSQAETVQPWTFEHRVAIDKVIAMRSSIFRTSIALCLVVNLLKGDPPFDGTVWVAPNTIVATDPSTFLAMQDAGQGSNITMYDYRSNEWISTDAFLFDVTFSDGLYTQFQVHEEFGDIDRARREAQRYVRAIGQLPYALRIDLDAVWIMRGNYGWGGGNRAIQIHTGFTPQVLQRGVLEEILLHEGGHVSLDSRYGSWFGGFNPSWTTAQRNDPDFISDYARQFPDREDMAESFPMWMALRYTPDRISSSMRNAIERTMPNRIAYFDQLELDMQPYSLPGEKRTPSFLQAFERINGFRKTADFDLVGIGLIYDEFWPAVYSLSLDAWLNIQSGGDPSGFFAYDYSGQRWIWTTLDMGWFYDFKAGTWTAFP
jgi:hypothetical protein